MVESMLNLKKHEEIVLKKIGNFDMWLDSDDLELLEELRAFLTPFHDLTLLVSTKSCSDSSNGYKNEIHLYK